MKLDRDIQAMLQRLQIPTPADAFAMQAQRDTDQAAGTYRPTADALAPFMGNGVPPRMESTEAVWTMEVPRILTIGGATVRELLQAHEATVEPRTDITPCEKNARRRIVLQAWQSSREYPEERCTVVEADPPHATHSGAGVK